MSLKRYEQFPHDDRNPAPRWVLESQLSNRPIYIVFGLKPNGHVIRRSYLKQESSLKRCLMWNEYGYEVARIRQSLGEFEVMRINKQVKR